MEDNSELNCSQEGEHWHHNGDYNMSPCPRLELEKKSQEDKKIAEYYKSIQKLARERAYKVLCEKMASVQILESPTIFEKEVVDWHIAREEQKESSKNQPWLWITIRPRPEVTLEEFVKCTKKCFQKKWFNDYMLCIEQSGEPGSAELGTGFHIHFLVHRGKKTLSACKTEIKNSFIHICNDPGFKFKLRSDKDLPGIKSYIMGRKDAKKLKKVEADEIWRSLAGFDPVYTPDNIQNLIDW